VARQARDLDLEAFAQGVVEEVHHEKHSQIKPVIVYCRIGERSSHIWCVLQN